MSFRLFLIIALSLMSGTFYGQGVKGRFTDSRNNPVPFAAIYDENTYLGTTSNSEGFYELRLPHGKHSLVIKSLGYFQERRTVEISADFILMDIQLKEQAYELKDVIVTPGKEDPAYAIMRKAIGLAPYHLNQVKEYSADVYLRGTIHVINMPKFISKRIEINGKKGAIKSGDVFLEESINQIDFTAPDKYNQKVKSFRTNMPGENSVSPMQIVKSSFYQPKIDAAVSPLASNAFSFYKYRYEGHLTEGDHTIFKIKVIPKRNSQQLMSGYIYIIDKLWCLHSVDVSQEMFFGQLNYKEIFSPVKSEAWLPISYVFYVKASMMGVKAEYKYASSVKYQKVALNERKLAKPVPEKEPEIVGKGNTAKAAKKQQEIEKLITKENLNNRDMIKLAGLVAKASLADSAKSKSLEIKDQENTTVTVEKDAMKKDTAYWNTARPIPLTTMETDLSGSIRLPGTDTVAKADTLKKKNTSKTWNKISKYLLGGASLNMFDARVSVKYNGLIGFNKFDFNTVDGFVYKQSLSIGIKTDSMHRIKIDPGIAYAFSRESLMWWLNSTYDYAPLKRGNLRFSFTSSSADYNQQGGAMNSQVNALASLFFRKNYKTFYEEHHFKLSNGIDIVNGLTLNSSIGFREVFVLRNHSDFSFFYRNAREYTPNIPIADPIIQLDNVDNKEAYFVLGLEYTPQYYFRIWDGRKHYQYSKYPTFYVNYKKAVAGIWKSDADFDYIEAGARQRKEWGMMHSFSWDLKGGKYLSDKKLFLSNYRFFSSQPFPVVFQDSYNSFFLPGLYTNYSKDVFAEAHVKFSTPYLFLKYLPFFSNKIWLENVHLNFLYTQPMGNYWEAGYSLSQIYAIAGIGVYAGFKGTGFQSAGLRLTFNFR